jgi:hypothetical protein
MRPPVSASKAMFVRARKSQSSGQLLLILEFTGTRLCRSRGCGSEGIAHASPFPFRGLSLPQQIDISFPLPLLVPLEFKIKCCFVQSHNKPSSTLPRVFTNTNTALDYDSTGRSGPWCSAKIGVLPLCPPLPPNQIFGNWTQSIVSARRRERVEDDLKGKDVERL